LEKADNGFILKSCRIEAKKPGAEGLCAGLCGEDLQRKAGAGDQHRTSCPQPQFFLLVAISYC